MTQSQWKTQLTSRNARQTKTSNVAESTHSFFPENSSKYGNGIEAILTTWIILTFQMVATVRVFLELGNVDRGLEFHDKLRDDTCTTLYRVDGTWTPRDPAMETTSKPNPNTGAYNAPPTALWILTIMLLFFLLICDI